jgi:conjugative relaxase-like TrwC/TraI family protein
MLVIGKSASTAAAKDYFERSLRIGDYYAEGQEIAGTWHGLAAARLGLTGALTREQFSALLDNKHPMTGDKLKVRTARVPGMDFTFTAPKSVSLLYGITGDERIAGAMRQAVIEAMTAVERDMKTRVRLAGKETDRITGNMAWGEFLHKTGRPVNGIPDPHLHVHAYAMNVTWDPIEKRFKAAQIGDLKGEAGYYEAVFHNALARGMIQLGYGIARHDRFFEVAGIGRELVDRFSRRREVVEEAARLRGIDDPELKKALSKLTRERKAEDLSLDELRAVWRSRLLPKDYQALSALQAQAQHARAQPERMNIVPLVKAELADALRSDSAVSEKEVLTRVLRRAFGLVRAADVQAALDSQGILRGEVAGRVWITTEEAHRQEHAVVGYAREGRLARAPLGRGDYQPAAFLNAGQRAAVEHIWSSPDRIMLVRGGAGVGKTKGVMAEALKGLAAAGHKCFVFTTTIATKNDLRAEGLPAETVQKLLISPEMQAQLGDDAVIFVDEARLLDVASAEKLFDASWKYDWRIVLIGDDKQHSAVKRGDIFKLLRQEARLPVAEVKEIVRQTGDYKRAVADLDAGRIVSAWDKLAAMGAIHEVAGRARIERLAADYLSCLERNETVLVVAPTNRERAEVSEVIREVLRSEGRIGTKETIYRFLRNLYWETETKQDASRYQVGMAVRFHQNASGGIVRGEIWEIEGRGEGGQVHARDAHGEERLLPLEAAERFQVYRPETRAFARGDRVRMAEKCVLPDGRELAKGQFGDIERITKNGEVRLTNGMVIPKAFPFLDHGYSSTSVSAQGLTVTNVLLAMGAESVAAMSREQFYVSVSRGKRRVSIYVDDVPAVKAAISQSSAKPTAIDLMRGSIRPELTWVGQQRQWRSLKRRKLAQLLSEQGLELELDARTERRAGELAAAEYLGRMRGNAAELGD